MNYNLQFVDETVFYLLYEFYKLYANISLHCQCMTLSCISIDDSLLDLAVNVCASNPCRNGGTCRSSGSGYTCSCISGWTGTRCESGKDYNLTNVMRNISVLSIVIIRYIQ